MEMQSLEIGKLAEALAKAQSKIRGAKKESKNPFFKSDYADLESVWEAIREPLSEHLIAPTQGCNYFNEQWVLVTTLMHSSGQWIKSMHPIIFSKNDPQSFGSAEKYAMRYALVSMIGVPSIDDDGEAAMHDVRNKQQLSDKQCAVLDSYLQEDPEAATKICKSKNIQSVYELDPDHFDGIVTTLKQRKEKRNEQTRVA